MSSVSVTTRLNYIYMPVTQKMCLLLAHIQAVLEALLTTITSTLQLKIFYAHVFLMHTYQKLQHYLHYTDIIMSYIWHKNFA